jgi:hypothetical protein
MSHNTQHDVLYGWLVCRFDHKQVHSILYGQFSRQSLPPSSGWVFLARNGVESVDEDSDMVKLTRDGLGGLFVF